MGDVVKLSDRRKPRVEPIMLPMAFFVAWLAVSVAMADLVRASFDLVEAPDGDCA